MSSDVPFQALEFLASHRDTIIILLKSEIDIVSVSLIDEVHLLASISSSVIPFVPQSELVSSTNKLHGLRSLTIRSYHRIRGSAVSMLLFSVWQPSS